MAARKKAATEKTAGNAPKKTAARKNVTPSKRASAKSLAVISTSDAISGLVLDFVGDVPGTFEPANRHPREHARAIAQAASRKAAIAAGSLALPPGPIGWMTLIPELTLIWRIQAQMVSDIAAAFGRRAPVSREQMLYCLFRHTAAQAFRDLGVRLGQRGVVQALSSSALRRIVGHIGVSLSKRTITKGVARWMPLLGAAGVAAYAWYDSSKVAATAMQMFDPVIDMPISGVSIEVPARRYTRS